MDRKIENLKEILLASPSCPQFFKALGDMKYSEERKKEARRVKYNAVNV